MTTNVTEPAAVRAALDGLLQNYSLEMTAKDVPQLEDAADIIPRGTKIAITFLPNDDFPPAWRRRPAHASSASCRCRTSPLGA